MVDNDKNDDKSDRNVDVIEEYGDRHLMDDNDKDDIVVRDEMDNSGA
jgi:hypothetical protein